MGMGAGGGILPYADIEGQQGLMARQARLVRRFPGRVSAPAATGAAAGRMARLPAGAAGALYLADEDEERQLQLIRSQLTDWQARLGEALRAAHQCRPVAGLPRQRAGESCPASASPRRSGQLLHPDADALHPFRQVCLLGMNDGVHPRTLAPMGFDLMAVALAARGPIPPG